jgi:hypothetical protein
MVIKCPFLEKQPVEITQPRSVVKCFPRRKSADFCNPAAAPEKDFEAQRGAPEMLSKLEARPLLGVQIFLEWVRIFGTGVAANCPETARLMA